MRDRVNNYAGAACALALAMASMALPAFAGEPPESTAKEPPLTAQESDIPDPDIRAWWNLTYNRKPAPPVPGKDYGMDPATGHFTHPKATPLVRQAPNFPGQLGYWDQKSYAK